MGDTLLPRGTVYIVDDDPAMRAALTFALEAAGLRVCAFETPEGLLRSGPVDRPAVLLLDVRLHEASGVELHAQLKAREVTTPVVFMSGQSQPQEIVDGFRQGALNFLVKPFNTEALLAAVDEGLAADQARQDQQGRLERLRNRLTLLTPREREVLRLMLRGLPNRDIAAAHGTVPGTVKLQRASVFAKLQLRGMAELAALFEGVDADALVEPDAAP